MLELKLLLQPEFSSLCLHPAVFNRMVHSVLPHKDAPALGSNQGSAAKEKVLNMALPSTACLAGHPGFGRTAMSEFLGFERDDRRTKLFLMEQHAPLHRHVVHRAVANSCSLPLELGQQLTAKAESSMLWPNVSDDWEKYHACRFHKHLDWLSGADCRPRHI